MQDGGISRQLTIHEITEKIIFAIRTASRIIGGIGVAGQRHIVIPDIGVRVGKNITEELADKHYMGRHPLIQRIGEASATHGAGSMYAMAGNGYRSKPVDHPARKI